MVNNSLQNKILNAAKWSTITEIVAKLVTPLTNIILARIIAPEAFGIIATVTMIISFADMFTDSGFQKYLIQHEFKNKIEKYRNANVAFWTNLAISIILWVLIFINRDNIANLVGNPGLGNVLAIACLQLPLTSFSSIQMALFRRDFDFKTLFIVRLVAIFIPIFLTIPLALLDLSYWALIIGTLVMQSSNAVLLTLKSKWRPNFYYNLKVLKKMFSFSIWSLIEAISIWLTTWIDTLFISRLLNLHQVGIYKTSTTMVNSLMALITASTVPVLFSTLSRLQNEPDNFNAFYFKFQSLVSILIFPIGVGVYLYRDLATAILLGSQWGEASEIIGIWALTSSLMIVFGNFSSEVYRAKGKPKLSFLAQVLHLVVLIPTIIIAGQYGFWTLVYARSWIRLQFVLVHFILMKKVIGIPVFKTLKNVAPTFISAITMGIIGNFIQQLNESLMWDLISIFFCILIYFTLLFLFPRMRKEIIWIFNKINPKSRYM